ncbi:LPS assembly protein LptD [Thauera sp.]|uniref:LPS-assembly protein LptD n=1 Tax=Thauera sp. TaxID=1905334 RepID=UPI0025870648|nr:LPS assembly protein LptD [Thauera sp.]
MAPNTRIRLIPLLLLGMSGATFAQGLPPLLVSPDLLRPAPARVVAPVPAKDTQRLAPVEARPQAPSPAAGQASATVPQVAVEERSLPAAVPQTQAVAPEQAETPRARQAQPADAPAAATVPLGAVAKLPAGTTAVSALRILGARGIELVAEGEAELQRDDVLLTADRVTYREPTDEVLAEGNVVMLRGQDRIEGPRATLVVGDQVGSFESPRYVLSREQGPREAGGEARPVAGSGAADLLRLEGENQFRLENATWTTCRANDPDWYIKARDLQLDYDREVGTARGGSVVFMDVPLFWMPWAEFPLNGQRQSGLLPPTFGSSNKTGVDFAQPYYFNLAPNYDATLAPRIMSRRGLQLGGEFRYLGEDYQGTSRVEWMPKDNVTGEERRLGALQHQHRIAPNLYGTVDLNAVSDDSYFEDLSSRIGVASRVNLLREGRLIYTGGWWTASALAQSYQTLSPDPESRNRSPYRRLPQLRLDAARADLPGGVSAVLNTEYVHFAHEDARRDRDEARRFTAYPQVSLPMTGAAWFVTPKAGLHYTSYDIDRSPADAGMKTSVTRSLPIVSVDSGLFFERDTNLFGGDYLQTLEPRLYYLRVPSRKQDEIPLFDTSRFDVGFAQLFSENRFSGSDRIGDANDLTAAVSTRLIESDTGIERLRAVVGQRYYFSDQKVSLNSGDTLRPSGQGAELLAGIGGRVTRTVSVDSYVQYNTDSGRSERINASVRYQPDFAKVLNLSYRYAPSLRIADSIVGLEDVDVSGQWPLGRGWYGVGRVTHSLKDNRVTEAIGGLEYNGGCWAFRIAMHRFAIDESDVTKAVFLQLELNDLASIGSNPVSLIKRSVPGYGKINDSSADRVFGVD